MSWSSEDHAQSISDFRRLVQGLVRRMTITLADGVKWQLRGHRGGSGGDEVIEVEPFSGVGFYSRPPVDGGKPEAIMLSVGGAKTPVIVATRDEATRRKAANLAADETAIFTSKAIVVITTDGSVEIRGLGGGAEPLATKADLDALKSAISSAAVVANDGGATFKANILSALSSWPVGTRVLKAE